MYFNRGKNGGALDDLAPVVSHADDVLKAVPKLPPPDPSLYNRPWNEEVEEEQRIKAAGKFVRAERIHDKMVNIPSFRKDLRERGVSPWKAVDEEICPKETELGISIDRDLMVTGSGLSVVNGRYFRDKDFKWRGRTIWHHSSLGPGLWAFGGEGVGSLEHEDKSTGVSIFYDLCESPFDTTLRRKQDGHGRGIGVWVIFHNGCRRYICERKSVLVTRPSHGLTVLNSAQFDQMLPPATGWKLGDVELDHHFPPKICAPAPLLHGCGVVLTTNIKETLANKLIEVAHDNNWDVSGDTCDDTVKPGEFSIGRMDTTDALGEYAVSAPTDQTDGKKKKNVKAGAKQGCFDRKKRDKSPKGAR
eukprot:GHVR01148011.1.p1 GENE.GHVR01148011.1~~GHVR01148011.1.p1  ORF type:complete len:360 (+),score=93.80 GHVR01148011.1:101-1180(+)